jgi:hypothetical protein
VKYKHNEKEREKKEREKNKIKKKRSLKLGFRLEFPFRFGCKSPAPEVFRYHGYRSSDGSDSCLESERAPGMTTDCKKGPDVLVPWVPGSKRPHNQRKNVPELPILGHLAMICGIQVLLDVIGDGNIDKNSGT